MLHKELQMSHILRIADPIPQKSDERLLNQKEAKQNNDNKETQVIRCETFQHGIGQMLPLQTDNI